MKTAIVGILLAFLLMAAVRSAKCDLDILSNPQAIVGIVRSTANELSFTFNSPDYPWNKSELTTLQTWVKDFYPVAKKIYGNPASNMTVDVTKNPDLPFEGVYEGDKLVLKSLDDTVLVHEMIHAFHGNYTIGFESFEEGMTRAAEVAVFNQLEAYTHWDENHSYSIDVYYEHDNQPDVAGKDGNFWSGYVNSLQRYQLAGYAWAKPFLEDNSFFVNFNQEYYAQASNDSSIRFDESRLKDILRKVKPNVEGYDFDNWYSRQYILNTSPTSGYKLVMKADSSDLYFFHMDEDGREEMQVNATVGWSVYDCNDNLLDSGTGITGQYGWIAIAPKISADYLGRIKIVVTAESPEGNIVHSFLRESPFLKCAGIFGVVENQNGGNITITPLDDPTPPATVMVVNGSFSAPSLEKARGRFSILYLDSLGQQSNRTLTKDASSCFAVVTAPAIITLESDLNRDGKVNIQDITIVAVAYRSKPGDANWTAIADLDKNGVVNIIDISMVAKDYGKTA